MVLDVRVRSLLCVRSSAAESKGPSARPIVAIQGRLGFRKGNLVTHVDVTRSLDGMVLKRYLSDDDQERGGGDRRESIHEFVAGWLWIGYGSLSEAYRPVNVTKKNER
jgi:hypothetical protein